MQKANIGLIGYQFMGKAHSHAYKDLTMFFQPKVIPVMKAICGRNEEAVKAAAKRYGWESYETSWEKLIERDDIDVIDISCPQYLHKDIAVAAAEAGKHIFCEKPLAKNLAEAEEMLDAVKKTGVKHMIGFNYRRVPAIGLAKRLILEERIGKAFHFRAYYLQSWIMDEHLPLIWKLDKNLAGSGALGDIGAHIIDLAHYLVGDIESVMGMSDTFIKERPLPDNPETKSKVEVDDVTFFLARFKNGAMGSFETTRLAGGRKNFNGFELSGSKGSLLFNFEDMNVLQYWSADDENHAQGFRKILVTEDEHPYISAWWPPGHVIGYEHTFVNEIYDFINSLADEDVMPSPDFEDGVKCQRVLDAVEKAVSSGCCAYVG